MADAVHISGYLHKMTRDGRWQKRWFETNGNFLTYYKSKKMTKVSERAIRSQRGSAPLDPSILGLCVASRLFFFFSLSDVNRPPLAAIQAPPHPSPPQPPTHFLPLPFPSFSLPAPRRSESPSSRRHSHVRRGQAGAHPRSLSRCSPPQKKRSKMSNSPFPSLLPPPPPPASHPPPRLTPWKSTTAPSLPSN